MQNYYKSCKLLLSRLLYVTIFYSISRLLFLFFQWNSFNNITASNFIGGIRFDLSAIFYTNLIIIIALILPGNFKYKSGYQLGVKLLFFIINSIFLATNFIDFVYYEFTGKRSNYDLITASGMEQEIGGLLPSFLKQYWYVFILFIAFIYAFWGFIPSNEFDVKAKTVNIKNSVAQAFIFPACIAFSVVIGRGGLQRKPLRRVDAVKYSITNNTPIVLNTPFCILKTFNKKEQLKPLQYFSKNELSELYSPVKQFESNASFNKKNIVIIILESFGDENVSYYNPENGNTPFLDSLIQKSTYFENGFANGRVSIDALPSILTGIPSIIGEPFIISSYAFNNIESLPLLLEKEGYHTAFFHGAFNGSQNFDQYAKVAGFNEYYGKDEYPFSGHEDGKWGIFDEEFLNYFGKQTSTFKSPFLSCIFTISSHVPFVIPERYEGKFEKGNTRFYECVGYTDYSLKKYFDYAKEQPWYNNTLFVITADHCSFVRRKSANSIIHNYTIPILFFEPTILQHKVYEKNMQQIDILPSILDHLGYYKPFVSYGNSYKQKDNLVINLINNSYHVVIDDYYFIFNGNKVIEMYAYKTDLDLKHNLKDIETEQCKHMELQIKAYLQSFNNDMISNSMVIDQKGK